MSEKTLYDTLMAYRRNSGATTIDSVSTKLEKEGQHVDRRDIISAFRRMENEDIGKLLVGRRGKKTRFEWYRDNTNTTSSFAKGGEKNEQNTTNHPTIKHEFVLRPPNYRVTLELPSDFSVEESERLATFVKAIPF